MTNSSSVLTFCFCSEELNLTKLLHWIGFIGNDREEARTVLSSSSLAHSPYIEDVLDMSSNGRRHKYLISTNRRNRSQKIDLPPPVIALSRSQSFGSISSTDSTLHPADTDVNEKSMNVHNCSDLMDRMETAGMFRNPNARTKHKGSASNTRDFTKRHEVLINSIFDIAKFEFVKSILESTIETNTKIRSQDHYKEIKSSSSVTTKLSSQSKSTATVVSEILSHTSHIFQNSLFQVSGTVFSRKRYPKQKKIVAPKTISYDIDDSSIASLSTNSENSCYTGKIAYFLLHPQCELQKDSGVGLKPGSIVSVRGREEAINKIVEKIIVLAELEQEGSYRNATLTRIPATDTTFIRNDEDIDKLCNMSETRSMFAVKLGFVNFRYGVLVQWNRSSGLAERIVLRKMCPESFMKIKNPPKMKGLKKKPI